MPGVRKVWARTLGPLAPGDVGLALLLLLIGGLLLGRYVPLDPDFHHDGLMLAIAVASSEGRSLHAEVFSQYGPITSWLQGYVVATFGPSLLGLRIQAGFSLLMGAILLQVLASRLGASRILSFAVALLWLASCPAWATGNGRYPLWVLPFALLIPITIGAILLAVIAIQKIKGRQQELLLFSSAFLLGIGLFVRINYMLPILVVAITFLLIRFRSLRVAVVVLVGACLGIAVPVLVMVFQSALVPHINQTLLGPLNYYDVALPNALALMVLFLVGPLPFLLSLGLAFAGARSTSLLARSLFLMASLLINVILVSISLGARTRAWLLSLFGQPSTDLGIVQWADLQAMIPMYALPLLCIAATLAICRRFDRSLTAPLLVGLCAIASLTQMYPLFDPYHLWWASPLGLAVLGWLGSRVVRVTSSQTMIALTLVPFIAGNLLLWNQIASRPRTAAPGPALDRMLIPKDAELGIRDADSLLASLPGGDVQFLCPDGLLAVWNGTYLASDASFVSWAFGTSLSEVSVLSGSSQDLSRSKLPLSRDVKADQDAYVLCTQEASFREVTSWAAERGLAVTSSTRAVQPRMDRPYRVFLVEPISIEK